MKNNEHEELEEVGLEELSRNQRRALIALLSTNSVAEASRTCQLSERTLFTYLQQEPFRRALRERQDAMLSSITSSLLSLSTRALETLAEVLDDETATPASKVRASLGILERAQRMAELNELAQRLVLLEQTVLEVRAR